MSEGCGSLGPVTAQDPSETPRLDASIVALRVVVVASTVVAAVAGYLGWADDTDPAPAVAAAVAASVAAVGAFVVWFLEERRKRALQSARTTVAELLRAEKIRILTMTNGAFLPTLSALQDLAAMRPGERAVEISGFRQAVVERACDLVKNESPRAAYFRVQDLSARRRVMSPRPYISQRARVDEFTSQFVEGADDEPGVWELIDHAEHAILREDVRPPGKVYRSYISAPVRCGGIAFGMLTLNVLDAGGLSTEDRDFLLVLARVLAVAEALALLEKEREASVRMSLIRSRIGSEGGNA